MSKSSVKESLQNLEKEELLDIIMGIYDFNRETKTYIENLFNPQLVEIQQKYKKHFEIAFSQDGISALRFGSCRKGIGEFAKMNPPKELLADLMLHLVEQQLHYCEYSQTDSYFDFEIVMDFQRALEFISSNHLTSLFADRIKACVRKNKKDHYFQSGMEDVATDYCPELFDVKDYS